MCRLVLNEGKGTVDSEGVRVRQETSVRTGVTAR